MIERRFSLYNDPKTEALYSQITNVHAPYSSEEQALLKEAERKTQINSHYSHGNPQQYLSNCYIYNGVSLVESTSSNAYKYKYRPYTILKSTQQTKEPISEQELYQRLANRRHQQIVYSYSNNVVSSPEHQPAISFIKLVHESSVRQPSVRSMEKVQTEVRPISEEKSKNRPKFVKSKDRSQFKRISQRSEHSARMSRLKKDESATFPVIETDEQKYTFKSVKNRAKGNKNKKNGAYNLFSCLDEPVHKQCSNQEYECGPNEIVASRLGSERWRK